MNRLRLQFNLSRAVLVVLLLLLVTQLLLGQNGRGSKERALLEPYMLREDFQRDSLGQFASYPPAQDVGYEPSLSPTKDFGAPGGRALMRIVKPNRRGPQRFGFIRKLRLTAGSDSRLRVSYRLNSPVSATIEIGLAGIDGQRYTTNFAAKTNEWSIADISFSELRARAGTGVEAIYIVTTIKDADPDFTYRFMIDDVTVTAVREARFDVQSPRTESIEPWPALVSAQSYRAGEAIDFSVRAPASMASVECQLATQTGTVTAGPLFDDGTHGDKAAGDGVWTNSNIYEVRASDANGLWIATVRGTTTAGQTVKTDIRLLIRPGKSAAHPRLFFNASDREKLLARSRDPKLASLWSYLQATAKSTRESGELANGGDVFELLDSEYLLPSLPGYFDVLNRARTRIAYNAFDAYLTGNADARNAAKAALLSVARWKRWEPPWFRAHGQHTYYPAGQLATDVALGYDLLYDDLSEPERALIRDALIEKSIVPTFKEYVADNRVMANTSNWIAHTVGGALIAAASIADDVPESDRKFPVYVNGLLRKLEDHMAASYLADGSYAEGISYHEFDAETLGPALVAIQRAFGIDYWTQTHVLDSLSYPLYTLAKPAGNSPDMGDTHPPAGHGIGPIVYQSKDPVVRWYYSQFDRSSLAKFIFYDDSVAPAPPTLPTSKIFRDKGNAVFRSGWDGDDLVFLYRAGPNFNHHHADQGSFLLTAFSEVLISEGNWSDYYKDPYYATFFTQAIGHNTVLVGGNPESQTIADTPQFKALNSYPRITDSITTDFYDSLASDLTPVYQGRLARYTRSVVFLKPDYFVVFDDLKTSGAPEQFDFLLHVADRDRVKTAGLSALYHGENGSLAVRSFPASEARLSVEDGRIPYHVFATRTPAQTPAQPGYLDFRTVRPANETQFVTVIAPAKIASVAQNLIGHTTAIKGENFTGLRVPRGDKTDLVLFRIGPSAVTIQHEGWSTDAAMLTITQKGSALELFAVQNGRSLRRGNQVLFSSETPVSVVIRFVDNGAEATVNTDKPTRITLSGTSLTVPVGQHQFKIPSR